jgi:hypothetical protein
VSTAFTYSFQLFSLSVLYALHYWCWLTIWQLITEISCLVGTEWFGGVSHAYVIPDDGNKCLPLRHYCIPKYYQKLQLYCNICSVFEIFKYPIVLNTKYIIHKLKSNPVVKTIQNYRNKWTRNVRRMVRDRPSHLIAKCQPCGNRSKGRPPQKICSLLMEWEQVIRPKPCKIYNDDDDDADDGDIL